MALSALANYFYCHILLSGAAEHIYCSFVKIVLLQRLQYCHDGIFL